jgi:hypothetical protein
VDIMMPEDRFEDFVREHAAEYNKPPETPREEMWARIQAERSARRFQPHRTRFERRWVWAGAAVAALLLLGIAIGRFTAPEGSGPPSVVEGSDPTAPAEVVPAAYRVAAEKHFGRAEVLLTQFRSDAEPGQRDAEFSSWARELLGDTRLLLDSPAAEDLEYRELLEDLELVLAQIVRAATKRRMEERQWVADSMDQRGVMERLRLLMPQWPAGAGT